MSDRIILHSDINNFYASAEILNMPEYKNVPLAVSGDPERRHGIILAKNMPAKAFGVKTGEAIWQAKQKCPELVCVPPHFEEYSELSERVFKIYTEYTDLVEPFGPDESWLDVTNSTKLFGNGEEIAQKIRARIPRETGLTVSIGVSFNKIFAKLGSDLKKPDAVSVISRENFRRVIWRLDADSIMGIGQATSDKLKKLNVHTIGDLANAPEDMLKSHFGIIGQRLKHYALGLDNEPVREYYKTRLVESVGHGITATRDLSTEEDVRILIYYLADLVGARLRKHEFKAAKTAVSLRDNTLSTISRQGALRTPTASGTDIAECAYKLAQAARAVNAPPLRTITVTAFSLSNTDDIVPADLFDHTSDIKKERLDAGLDKIRAKFGRNAVVRGNLIAAEFIYDKVDAETFLPFKR
ncbi:MAG: DNA polymerase IV [Clostridiales bacterium]|jgi:DNA polymerase-4|nr:DNA polymerase IV [Clostridiales bacterium]